MDDTGRPGGGTITTWRSKMDFPGLDLFLDDELVAYTRNIRRDVQQARKRDENPIRRAA